MYQKNDFVMYGSVGVCSVDGTCVRDDGNAYYVLQPVFTKNSIIYAPVNNCKVSIRNIISRDEADEIIDMMPEVEPFTISNRREKEMEYKKALKSGKHNEWLRLVKTLYNRKSENVNYRQSFSETDRMLLCSAERLLNGELAVALQIPFEKVSDYIMSRLETA